MERGLLTEQFLQQFRLVLRIPLVEGEPLRSAHPVLVQHQQAVTQAVAALWSGGGVQRLLLTDREEDTLLMAVPVSPGVGVLLGWSLSVVSEMDRRYRETVFHLTRDLVYVASEGRIMLGRREEVPEIIGTVLESASLRVEVPEDIGRCRALVMERLTSLGHPSRSVLEFALAVSEAVTNAVKHGHGGWFTFLRSEGVWNALVEDQGPGIPLWSLPHAMMKQGFSTMPEKGLGLGFSTMLRCVDRIVLDNSLPGVTLLLQKSEPGSDGGKIH